MVTNPPQVSALQITGITCITARGLAADGGHRMPSVTRKGPPASTRTARSWAQARNTVIPASESVTSGLFCGLCLFIKCT